MALKVKATRMKTKLAEKADSLLLTHISTNRKSTVTCIIGKLSSTDSITNDWMLISDSICLNRNNRKKKEILSSNK